MDPVDDFEMRPITPGLGFHKKPVSLKDHVQKSNLANKHTRKNLPNSPDEDFFATSAKRETNPLVNELHSATKVKAGGIRVSPASGIRLSDTLPRHAGEVPYEPDLGPRPGSNKKNPLDKVNFQIPAQSISDALSPKRSGHDSMVAPLSPVSFSVPAFMLDAVIIVALSMIFVLGLVVATGLNVTSVLTSAQMETGAQLSLLVMYLAVFAMYSIVARSFFGCTVGEWTFELQLGDDDQLNQAIYPAKVLWRSVLNLATGLVLLPVISMIMRTDVSGKMSGLQLYKRND
jgi:hypothetical protein